MCVDIQAGFVTMDRWDVVERCNRLLNNIKFYRTMDDMEVIEEYLARRKRLGRLWPFFRRELTKMSVHERCCKIRGYPSEYGEWFEKETKSLLKGALASTAQEILVAVESYIIALLNDETDLDKKL